MNYLRLNMTTPQKVVLLACGSFNPPTNMHLRMFELGRDHLQRGGKYNVIAGIMSPVSDGYNKKDLVSAKHRCAMVKLAIKSSKWIRMDTWECEQPDWTETAKVLSHHQLLLDNQANTQVKFTPSKKRKKDKRNEEFIDRVNSPSQTNNKEESEHENVQLKLLCGGDLLESFAVPGLWADDDIEEIVKKYGLVCVTRNGSDPRKFIYESDVLSRNQDNIHIVTEWIQNEISSTKIRRALRRDESVKYLIQDSVIDYIREHELYGLKCDKIICEKCQNNYLEGFGSWDRTIFICFRCQKRDNDCDEDTKMEESFFINLRTAFSHVGVGVRRVQEILAGGKKHCLYHDGQQLYGYGYAVFSLKAITYVEHILRKKFLVQEKRDMFNTGCLLLGMEDAQLQDEFRNDNCKAELYIGNVLMPEALLAILQVVTDLDDKGADRYCQLTVNKSRNQAVLDGMKMSITVKRELTRQKQSTL
ncbi:nicotinamide/nicotinic acid mononucleotide adenylyltransferase 1-like isoform X2 [Mercenaria mercenaria]|uniref:nicotinamide/nicotinic acid mononucleotide adenylyltransferase 1-like isoform X2 n=1 Tax=Mercenaria mercenaria TaxID=6596 RepID=UPI00234F90E1|nr:nicotinamide/nicotinic acid mononucleotide adenylyltransferase 1-like isoform X2 [Mercenaria mercenaria]